MALATPPTPAPRAPTPRAPTKVAVAAAGQASSMRGPLLSELTSLQRAQRGAKRSAMIGLNGDQTTRHYTPVKGGGGVWTNSNGTQIGTSSAEDTRIRPSKSTGDTPPTSGRRDPHPPPGRVQPRGR